MSERTTLLGALDSQPDAIAGWWLEYHLEALVLPAEEEPVARAHGRAPALLEALRHAVESGKGRQFGCFEYREVVQVIALMARALAENDVGPAAAGALVPALGRALERTGADDAGPILVSLAGVAVEAYTAARLTDLEQRRQAELFATTPLLRLRPDTLFLVVTASPDRSTALALVDRALQEVMRLKTSTPRLILDLSNLSDPPPDVIEAFLSLDEELTALGGKLLVTGIEGKPPLTEHLEAIAPRGLLGRLGWKG